MRGNDANRAPPQFGLFGARSKSDGIGYLRNRLAIVAHGGRRARRAEISVMIRSIIAASLQFRFLILAAALALIAFGTVGVGRMAVDVLPEFAPPTVEVQTEAIGLSAEEVESLITIGLEELLSGVPWLESTRSRSMTGLSTITLIFKRGTDLIKARQMVQERLILDYKLPNVATPPVILQTVSTTNRFMMIGISSDTIDPTELSLLARWTIKPRLTGVPGVANVAIWGQRLRQMHVQIHPERLRDARVIQDDIIAAAGDALWVSPLTFLKSSASAAGGWIDNPNQRLGVEHSMPIETPEDMAKIPVTPEPELRLGRALPLGDVAELTYSHAPLIGDAFVNGGNGLLLVLEKFPSAGVPDVTRGVETAIAELARGLPGVKIDTTVFRLASYIEASTTNVGWAMLAGALLAIVVALLLLQSWHSALIVAVATALSLLAALTVLQLSGVTFNTMMLAGLVVALAVVIDEAVADVDRCARGLPELPERTAGVVAPATMAPEATTPAMPSVPPPPSASVEATRAQVSTCIAEAARESRALGLYPALIVVLSAAPIFYVGGLLGAFLEPFAGAYLLAILASLPVGLTVTPALTLLLSGKRVGASALGAPSLIAKIRARCERTVGRINAAPALAFVSAGALIVAGAIAWLALGESLLPTLQEREIVVTWNTPPGTSHPETQRITARVCRELKTLAGVRSVAAHIGRAVTGDQVVGINAAQIWIAVDPAADYAKTEAAIRETIDGYPGIEHSVHTYLRDKMDNVLTGEDKPVVVRIYGPKREVRQQKAEEVRRAIAGIDGLFDAKIEGEIEEPQVQVKVNLDAAGRADVKPGDVRRASATIFSGIVVGYLFKEQKIFEVVVWGAPEARQSLANLREVWIDKADRTRVRLSDVAEVSIASTPTVIRHERITPYVDVVANVASGQAHRAVVRAIGERLRGIEFPIEHRPELLGEFAERGKSQQRMLGIVAAALIGIFLLLQACFRSWTLALAGFGAIVAALAGAVLAAGIFGGGALSLGSMLGLLGVVGVAARHVVPLIDEFRRAGTDADAAAHATHARSAPVIAGTAIIVAALLPIVVRGAIPGLEIAQGIAVALIGGSLVSGLVTLLLVPPLCVHLRSWFGNAQDSNAFDD